MQKEVELPRPELCQCKTCVLIRSIPETVRSWCHGALIDMYPLLHKEFGDRVADLARTIFDAEESTTVD